MVEPIAEAIVSGAAVVGLDEKPCLQELRLGEPGLQQPHLEGVLSIRRDADAERLQSVARHAPSFGIEQRLTPFARLKGFLERPRRRLERIEQAEPFLGRALELRVGLWQLQAGFAREPLHRLRESEALRLHDKGENVAMLAAREAMIESLLVVDGEGGRLLLIERAQPLPLAPGAF